MVMLGIGWMAISSDTDYELSFYEVSTYKRRKCPMTRRGELFGRIPHMGGRTWFYRSRSAPGFASAQLWCCCFKLTGVEESCYGSCNG